MDQPGEDALQKVINQIGFLMNSVDPAEEINKLMALEMTLNPKAQEMNYQDIMTAVVIKLVAFYNDVELQNLWTEYLLSESDEDLEVGFEDEEEDGDGSEAA